MVIPSRQETMINHNEYQETTPRFLPRFTCLLATYVLVVAIHPLGGSCANRPHTPNPQPGAAQPTQDGDPQATSNSLEMPFVISHGEGSRTLHNYFDRSRQQSLIATPRSSNYHVVYLLANTKSSKISTGPNRLTNATRCKTTMQCTRGSPLSLK
jgi:hypothetical protein